MGVRFPRLDHRRPGRNLSFDKAPELLHNERHGHENAQRDHGKPRGTRAAVGPVQGQRSRVDRTNGREPSGLVGGESYRDVGRLRRSLTRSGDWDESKHPRGKTSDESTPGSFAPAEGGGGESEARVPVAHSTKDYRRFYTSISAAKAANKYGASVHVYEPDEYKGMRLFLSSDGKAGFALKGNDIVSAFKHPDAKIKNFADHALRQAI